MTLRIGIDSFFRAQIPALSEEERAQLEANLIEHGCREPLSVWPQADGSALLLDGHNRHEICTRNGIAFDVACIELDSRAAAEDWIDANQLGRRNLTADAFRLLLGRRYNRQKDTHGGDRSKRPLSERASVQSGPLLSSPPAKPVSGKTADRIAAQHGVSPSSVRRAAKFAAEVEASPALSDAVARGEPVKKAKQQLKRTAAVRRGEQISESNMPLKPTGRKYQTIYADPPWEYSTWGEAGTDRSASNHYPTMSVEDIAALDVGAMAADDCALFLWTCWPNLREALNVIDAWGFTYSSVGFVWIKTNKNAGTPFVGMGHWTRSNSEPCLLATRGKPVRLNSDVSEVVMAPRQEHSRKPKIHGQIERLVPGPYLEMFCRDPAEGWDRWGNQSEGIF